MWFQVSATQTAEKDEPLPEADLWRRRGTLSTCWPMWATKKRKEMWSLNVSHQLHCLKFPLWLLREAAAGVPEWSTHSEDDKKYLISCFFFSVFFSFFQNKQHTSDAFVSQVFFFTPPGRHVSALYYCPEMSKVRTGYMKMMSQAGNIAGGKKKKRHLRKWNRHTPTLRYHHQTINRHTV